MIKCFCDNQEVSTLGGGPQSTGDHNSQEQPRHGALWMVPTYLPRCRIREGNNKKKHRGGNGYIEISASDKYINGQTGGGIRYWMRFCIQGHVCRGVFCLLALTIHIAPESVSGLCETCIAKIFISEWLQIMTIVPY